MWKAAKPEEPDDVKFDSPWGKGRPGWHIECSAMAMRYLGETFDIHGGGIDLNFPHHENEIAQSETANGKPFARYWMHHGLTKVNTKKISKSDASPEMIEALSKMTLHNVLATYPGELVRFFVLGTHYRRPIEYTDEEFERNKKGLESFHRLFERVERICGRSPYSEPQASARADVQSQALSANCDQHTTAFTDAMDDDFNTAGAIAALFEFSTAINRFIEESKLESGGNAGAKQDSFYAAARLIGLGRLIGLFLDPPSKSAAVDGVADKAMKILIYLRQHLRKKKDFETADLIRNLLSEQKITLEDRPDGTTWRAE